MNGENLSEKEAKRARNDANNARTVAAAANVAEKSGHPVAAAIGKGVKIADKVSGGKATQKLGKAMTTMNKLSGPAGWMAQAASNSGMSNRIAKAMNKKNNPEASNLKNNINRPQKDVANQPSSAPTSSNDDSQSSETGFANFELTIEHIKIALIVFAPIMAGMIVICLIVNSSLVNLKMLTIGSADSTTELSSSEIQDKFDKNKDEEDLKDDNEVGFVIDISGKNQFKNSKLIQINDTKTVTKKYNEADLAELEDYFPSIKTYKEEYDEDMVYDFFYKIYSINNAYKSKYKVNVDVPLLMATLMMQSDDMNEIFDSNLSFADRDAEKREGNIEEFDYEYDWSNYITTENSSEHDIEVLTQNMFSHQVKETCVDSSGKVVQENILRDEERENKTLSCEDGETYKTENLGFKKDDEKYKMFLKKFLRQKYYTESSESGGYVSGSGTLEFNGSYSNGNSKVNSIIVYSSEPDPSIAINYWSYVDTKNFVYPKDKATGLSLGAWPKDYKKIPAQLENPKVYQGEFIWPCKPVNGKYAFVYEHNGIDIMSDFGTPIYSPVDAILEYSTWGHTVNKGSDETAYSVTLTLEKPVKYAGVNIDTIFLTHMSGIRYRCEWGKCNRKVKKGELLGFSGNAAGTASSAGWAPHLHMSLYNSSSYSTGIGTSSIEKLYNITSGTKRNAGG